MVENCQVDDCQKRLLMAALREIHEIVHTPTKATKHKSANDHFQADFDAIRRVVAPFVFEEGR